ncbi:unnamed protein product [Protopolystoma xenopodis]|uniref:Uncharacterized protein n=1 Tax=Protopolystoma xenopodis TaxID=117903 RepID=A0A3S5CI25_9PLAT|nr:unnamed protein product [Protopolystoma xenopodis]
MMVINEQALKEKKSLEKVREKLERIAARQQAFGKNISNITEHYILLRSGDYYMFEGDPEEDDDNAVQLRGSGSLFRKAKGLESTISSRPYCQPSSLDEPQPRHQSISQHHRPNTSIAVSVRSGANSLKNKRLSAKSTPNTNLMPVTSLHHDINALPFSATRKPALVNLHMTAQQLPLTEQQKQQHALKTSRSEVGAIRLSQMLPITTSQKERKSRPIGPTRVNTLSIFTLPFAPSFIFRRL